MHTAESPDGANTPALPSWGPSADGDATPGDGQRRLRLLFIADMELWPLHSGIHQRLHELATGLAERHDVTVVMLSHYQRTEFPRAERFTALHVVPYDSCAFGRVDYRAPPPLRSALHTVRSGIPAMVRGWRSEALIATLRELGGAPAFDVTWATRGYFAEQAVEVGLDPVIVDLPDVDSVLVRQQRPRWHAAVRLAAHCVELRAVRRWERRFTSRSATVVVCKSDDARVFDDMTTTAVVANGVSVPASPAGAGDRPDEILFVGSLDWGPNIDAVSYFARDALPIIRSVRPSARFVIAGKLPSPEVAELHDGEGCLIVADPPDLDELYRRATIVVVPMRLGSGTRLKVLEALAHGKALVSTAVGTEGIGITSGTHYIRAELPDGFADACLTLLADRDARVRFGVNGRAWVVANARWDQAVDRADEIVRRAVTSRTRSGTEF